MNEVDEPKQANLSETFYKSLYPLLKMCLYPKKIRNNGFMRLGGMPFVTIPCGTCRECQEVKKIDYYLRTMAIYKELFPDNQPSNWSVWFCTLTFAPEHLPYVNAWSTFNPDDDSENYEGFFPSFNHQLLKRFLKSFKQYFTRDLGLPCPHILVTCEYGEKKHRPHYHMQAFIPKIYKDWREFRDIMLRFWHYGFVKNVALKTIDGKTQERHVCDSIKYVCKYACKGSSWLPQYVKNKWVTDIRRHECFPRVFTTNGYGSQLEKMLTYADYERGKFVFADLKKQRIYNVPQYLKRRYFIQNHYEFVEKQECSQEAKEVLQKMPYYDEEKDTKPKYKYWNNSKYINNYEYICKSRFASKVRKELFALQHDNDALQWSYSEICKVYPFLSFHEFRDKLFKIDISAFARRCVQNSFFKPVKCVEFRKIDLSHLKQFTAKDFLDFLPLFQALPKDEQDRQLQEFFKWYNCPPHITLRKYLSNVNCVYDFTNDEIVVYWALLFAQDFQQMNKIMLSDAKFAQEQLWLHEHCQKPDE